jgi:hypothetical protein
MVLDEKSLAPLRERATSIVDAMHRVLDEDKNLVKVSPAAHIAWWVKAHEGNFRSKDESPARVGWDSIQGIEISTVFSMAPMPGPDFNSHCYFESMVFGLDSELSGDPMYRYQTWDDAEKGHATLVGLVNELLAKTKPKELPPHE